MPTYEVVDTQKYDAPVKTEVTVHAIVSGPLTKRGLEALLDKLYREASDRRDFTYHGGRATHLFIYLYTSEAHYRSGMGQWIAMLYRVGESAEVQTFVNAEHLSQVGAPPQVKFGLTEDKRKEVYELIVVAEDKAALAAQKRYPSEPAESLKIGQVLQLTEETPLMPELAPADPMAAIAKIRSLPPGAYIKVHRIAMKNGSPWYEVESIDREKRPLGTGWINGLALMGQTKVDPLKQRERRAGLQEQLAARYRSEVAEKYGLTMDQLSEIGVEGDKKNWPMPPWRAAGDPLEKRVVLVEAKVPGEYTWAESGKKLGNLTFYPDHSFQDLLGNKTPAHQWTITDEGLLITDSKCEWLFRPLSQDAFLGTCLGPGVSDKGRTAALARVRERP